MATFNKGGAGSDSLSAKEMEGPTVWAVYPHWQGDIPTKDYGLSSAVRAEVYRIADDGGVERAGSAVFFQTVLRKLPLEEWSVGHMVGPESGQRYFDLVYSADTWDEPIEKAMASLPEHPELPEGPFDDKQTETTETPPEPEQPF